MLFEKIALKDSIMLIYHAIRKISYISRNEFQSHIKSMRKSEANHDIPTSLKRIPGVKDQGMKYNDVSHSSVGKSKFYDAI